MLTWNLWAQRNLSGVLSCSNVQLSWIYDWKCISFLQTNGSYVILKYIASIQCWSYFTLLAIIVQRPCHPSPCGPNSQCREINGQGVCSCVRGYIGSPPSCRPECVINSECPLNEACINQKCVDPCPGSCGQSGESSSWNLKKSRSCFYQFFRSVFYFIAKTTKSFLFKRISPNFSTFAICCYLNSLLYQRKYYFESFRLARNEQKLKDKYLFLLFSEMFCYKSQSNMFMSKSIHWKSIRSMSTDYRRTTPTRSNRSLSTVTVRSEFWM